MKKKRVYLDYAATTPVDKRVLKAMEPYWQIDFANPSSLHFPGREAQKAVEQSRLKIASAIGADPGEIIFTSSATESNNLALKGLFFSQGKKPYHLIVSSIEHDCVFNTAKWLAKQGIEVDFLPVDNSGLADPKVLKKMIKENTLLVSVIFASNEIGTIQPVEELAAVCRAKGVLFHTDAAQALDKVAIDVKKMKIDLLTASSHKIYGPKGAACLYVRKGIALKPLFHGGGQEEEKRSSTLNVSGIVGFGTAVELSCKEMAKHNKKMLGLRRYLISRVLKNIKHAHLTGHKEKRLANHASFRFDFIEGEALLMELDNYGFSVSTGSACSSKKLEPSHVLLALGLLPQEAHGSLRVTLGRETAKDEIKLFLEALEKSVKKLRKISPFG